MTRKQSQRDSGRKVIMGYYHIVIEDRQFYVKIPIAKRIIRLAFAAIKLYRKQLIRA